MEKTRGEFSDDGVPHARRIDGSPLTLRDQYHYLITRSWPTLLVLLGGGYLVANLLFAAAYAIAPGSVASARTFADYFFFSVQTMGSIGYGVMHPIGTYANTLVVLESMTGLLGVAMATGLIFSKFSQTTARVLFSRNVVVQRRDGVPCLVIRMANERIDHIVEAHLRLFVLGWSTTKEGERIRRFIDLPLARDRSPLFALTWTAYHPIDEKSPLRDETPESMREKRAVVFASLTGVDGTFGQLIHARHAYPAEKILWAHRFVDVMEDSPQGRVIHLERFHEIAPEENPETTR